MWTPTFKRHVVRGSTVLLLFVVYNWGNCSVQFSHSDVSDSLQPHELQHARPPGPSPTPEFTQIHVHWVSDAIQPSHPLSSPSTPALNLSQHLGLFKLVSSSHQVAKVLELQFQHQLQHWDEYWACSFGLMPHFWHVSCYLKKLDSITRFIKCSSSRLYILSNFAWL